MVGKLISGSLYIFFIISFTKEVSQIIISYYKSAKKLEI